MIQNGEKVLQIKELVEISGRTYSIGKAYYELVKKETVQPLKDVAILSRKDNAIYVGTDARSMLGLPHDYVMIAPKDHPDYDIFIQSTSVNRKIMPNQRVMYIHG